MFDQTVKRDAGKILLTLAPRKIMTCIARVRMWAVSQKYKDPESWRSVEIERYREATYRHFYAYLDDPHGVDEESGLPHLWHLATNVAFLCELEDTECLKNVQKMTQEDSHVIEVDKYTLEELKAIRGQINAISEDV